MPYNPYSTGDVDYSDEFGELYSNIIDPDRDEFGAFWEYGAGNMQEFGGVSSPTSQEDIGRHWFNAQRQLFNYDIDPTSAQDDWVGSMNLLASVYQPLLYGMLPFGTSISGQSGQGIQGSGGVYVNAPIMDGEFVNAGHGGTTSTHPTEIISYLLQSPEGAALSRLKIDDQEYAEIEETFDIAEERMRTDYSKVLKASKRDRGGSGLYSSGGGSGEQSRENLLKELKYLATEEESAYDHFFGMFGQEVQEAFMSLDDRGVWDAFGPEGSRDYDEDHWFFKGRYQGQADQNCMNDYITAARENGTFDVGTAFEAQAYCS